MRVILGGHPNIGAPTPVHLLRNFMPLVADYGDLRVDENYLRESILEPLDHRNLNTDCPEFADLNPTAENIARVIFHRLDRSLPGDLLGNVRVYETPKTWADYRRADEPIPG